MLIRKLSPSVQTLATIILSSPSLSHTCMSLSIFCVSLTRIKNNQVVGKRSCLACTYFCTYTHVHVPMYHTYILLIHIHHIFTHTHIQPVKYMHNSGKESRYQRLSYSKTRTQLFLKRILRKQVSCIPLPTFSSLVESCRE